MKILATTFKIQLTFILLVLTHWLMGQTYAERALYRDAFSSTQINTLEVINKYGSIHIKTWEKDSIKISTDVYLSSTSMKKLEKLKEGIKIKYSQHNKGVLAQTIFGDNQTAFMRELQDISRSLSPSTEKRIEINYEIYMPEGITLTIKNQYGDVFLGSIENKLIIEQSNGSFKAHDLKGETSLNFRFVNAMVNDIKEGRLNLDYSTINLNKSINLNCESKSSEIYADVIGVLKLKSSRDKINIGKLDYIYGSASYTNLKILEINKEIDVYSTYGQINIDKMASTTTLIDIDSERTDIKLYIPQSLPYTYDILYSIDADLILPQKNLTPTNDMETEEMKAVKGSFGNNATLDIRIRALKRCLIQIHNTTDKL